MSYTEFKEAYIEALLWSELDIDEDGEDIDNFEGCEHELDNDALAAIDSCCGDFWQWIVYRKVPEDRHAQAGHDFCLTRNRHGAGFWDGNWDEPLASALTKAAKSYGPMHLYRIDENTITVGG